MAYNFVFTSFFTTGFFSSLTFAFPLAAAPFAFFANGLSSSLSLLSSFLTFLALLVDALGFAGAAFFFFANGFSSSDDSSSSLSSLYCGLALERPADVPFDFRAAGGFLADKGVSSSDISDPEGVEGFWTRRG